MSSSERYLFGDAPLAARRLKVLAEVFAESTQPFLLISAEAEPGVVVDIGCGPGYSTHLLAKSFKQARVVGLDNSESYISLARETRSDRVSFALHDVTKVPFPVTPADLLYCRPT